MRLLQITSYDALRSLSAAWDDLWQRSESTLPVARAAPLLAWLEHFAPTARFHALAVEQDGRLLAALPLVERRRGLLRTGALPNNEWGPSGDFLFDPTADEVAVLDLLASGIRQLPWPLVWIEGTSNELPHWRRLTAALTRAKLPQSYDERYRVGVIEFSQSWDDYQAAWSGNHRRHMRKALKRAEAEDCQLSLPSLPTPDELRELLVRGFAIEDRGWKGTAGSSVMRSPGMLEFFQKQALALQETANVQLVFLDCDGQSIAFEYGWIAKGVYYSPKVGYDEAFSQLSPGQILRYKLLEQFFADPQRRRLDFCGPLADATAKWITRDYSLGRLLIGTRPVKGGALIYTLRKLLPQVRGVYRCLQNWRENKQPAPRTQPDNTAIKSEEPVAVSAESSSAK